MRILSILLFCFSLLFSLEVSSEQINLAKSLGVPDAVISQELSKAKNNTQDNGVKNENSDKVENELSKSDDISEEKILSTKKSIVNGSENIKRYGSLFFNNKNKINPYSLPTPENYRLTYDDRISVTIYGASNDNFNLKVDNNGQILIPKVGKKKIIGLSFEEAKNMIKEEIKIAYPNTTNILVDISKFSSIQILISGLVKSPGIINLSSFSTIKDALLQSGGILNNGSYRTIYLKRSGKIIKTFDLYSLIRYGDTSNDTILRNGDVIFVSSVKKSITLTGDVNFEAKYELKENESFKKLFNFASGFKVSANKNAIQLKRYEDNTQKVYTINIQQLYKMTPKDGDIIKVYPKSTVSAKYVVLTGNIVAPGEKEIPKDKKLSTLLKGELEKFTKDGFFLKNTYYGFGTVKNENKITTFNLQNVLDGKEDVSLKIWDEIEIYKVSEDDFIEVTGDIVDETNTKYKYFEGLKLIDLFNIVSFKKGPNMQVDDKLVHVTRVIDNKIETFSIPHDQLDDFEIKPFDKIKFFNFSNINESNKATIKGEVFLSGTYSISENTTINDLVKLSGGFTKKALKSRFELARYTSDGYERTRKIHQLDLEDALKKNLKIFPDDEITIFPIANWNEKKYIEIKGLVRFPGKYPIAEGEKLSSVLERAGGFMPNAFVEGAVFTREEVKTLQQKSLEDSIQRVKSGLIQSNLNAAEAGETSSEKQKMLSTVQLLEKEAKENKPIGRISLNLYHDLTRFKNSNYDIVLKDKDTLYIPAVNDTVSVVGEVLNQNTFVYQPDLDVDNYIAKAGGLNMNADDDFIYVIKANGEAFKFEKNFYFSSHEVFKGDTIVVPLKVDIVSDIDFAKDVTQIVYQLAVTAASLNSIGSL